MPQGYWRAYESIIHVADINGWIKLSPIKSREIQERLMRYITKSLAHL